MFFAALCACLAVHAPGRADSGGITPEQIYQPKVDWAQLIGTWEALPDESPLEERPKKVAASSLRILMTLRKDGTCRVFNRDHPSGADGLWTFDDHAMFITFPNAKRLKYYVYGVKDDFMVTRNLQGAEIDLLWSRVK